MVTAAVRRWLASRMLAIAEWIDRPAAASSAMTVAAPQVPPAVSPQTLHRWAALAETVEEEHASIIVIGGTGRPGSPMRYLALPEPRRTWIE